jgi:hypothetical protein
VYLKRSLLDEPAPRWVLETTPSSEPVKWHNGGMDPGNLTGPRLLAQSQEVRDRVARCLRGFSAPTTGRPAPGASAFGVKVPWGRPLDPWAIRFFIVDVVGGQDVGRDEKQAWAAPLEVDGSLIWFAFRKFGVSATVYGAETEVAAAGIVTGCMQRMAKAIPVVTRDLVGPLIAEAVTQGAFTVPNKFGYFHGMYAHLRSLSEETAAKAAVTKPVHETHGDGGTSTHFPAAVLARNAEFEAVGSLFAFFGLLEHLLVIGLAFTEYDPLQEPFGDFLRMNWGEKFKRVVGLKDKDDKLIYDMLKLLADENRNPSAHGGVDRNVTNIHVHLVGYGAVPTGVTATSQRPTYTFEPELPTSVFPFADYHVLGGSVNGWEAVDKVLAWMRSGPLADAFTYGESTLPVWFDDDSRKALHSASAAGELEEFMDRRSFMIDQASNMDW